MSCGLVAVHIWAQSPNGPFILRKDTFITRPIDYVEIRQANPEGEEDALPAVELVHQVCLECKRREQGL
eukprot:2236391-Amphidinium_carterae.1